MFEIQWRNQLPDTTEEWNPGNRVFWGGTRCRRIDTAQISRHTIRDCNRANRASKVAQDFILYLTWIRTFIRMDWHGKKFVFDSLKERSRTLPATSAEYYHIDNFMSPNGCIFTVVYFLWSGNDKNAFKNIFWIRISTFWEGFRSDFHYFLLWFPKIVDSGAMSPCSEGISNIIFDLTVEKNLGNR